MVPTRALENRGPEEFTLRTASGGENNPKVKKELSERAIKAGGTSKFKGVSWNNTNQKWRAQIAIDGKLVLFGGRNGKITLSGFSGRAYPTTNTTLRRTNLRAPLAAPFTKTPLAAETLSVSRRYNIHKYCLHRQKKTAASPSRRIITSIAIIVAIITIAVIIAVPTTGVDATTSAGSLIVTADNPPPSSPSRDRQHLQPALGRGTTIPAPQVQQCQSPHTHTHLLAQ